MRTLVTGGTVITMDPANGDLDRGDVLIEDGVITAVAEHLDAADAEAIDASNRIVLPGFVDTHRHTWQTAFRGLGTDWTFPQWATAMHGTLKPAYLPEDVHIGTLLGRLEALHSGVTTMLDWFHCGLTSEYADAAVAALREAPGRSVFCHGAGWGGDAPVEQEIRRARATVPGDALLDMAFGLRGAEVTGLATYGRELDLAAELGLRTSVHIDAAGDRHPVAELHAAGLLRETTTFVHANGLADDELRMLADAGCSASLSPDVELKMGFGWPMTGRMRAAGLRPALSIDDTPAVGGDPFSTMRTALAVQRGLDGTLNARDVLAMSTQDGADALGLGHRIGSLTPGKQADLVLLRTDDITIFPPNHPVGSVVASGHPGLVDTVMVAGRIVKRDGALIGADLPALRDRLLASRDRIAAVAGVVLDGSWRPV